MKKTKTLLLFALFFNYIQGAWAQTEDGVETNLPDGSVNYVECSWDAVNKEVKSETKPCNAFITLTGYAGGDWEHLGDGRPDNTGWYVVRGDVTRKVLNIFGTVHIILCDGAKLRCGHIKLEAKQNAVLHIHSESQDGTGILSVMNVHNFLSYTPTRPSIPKYDETGRKKIFLPGAGDGKLSCLYDGAAAIGGGEEADMGSLIVYGGTIEAETGNTSSAAIGGGKEGSIGGEVIIYGGTVSAVGRDGGAGIGGGRASQGGPVLIYGGNVYACAEGAAAAIGGGRDGSGGTVKIYGGRVTATANIYKGSKSGAGIGGGYGYNAGEVYIYGGEVEACGGSGNPAIGGSDGASHGLLKLADNMKVAAGPMDERFQPAYERVFTTPEREAACHYRRCAKINICDHSSQNGDDAAIVTTYTIDDDVYHTRHCRYCDVTAIEKHTGEECVCGQVSRIQFSVYGAGTTKDSYVEIASATVGAGKNFILPHYGDEPVGYIFAGWEMNPETVGGWAAVRGDDFIMPEEPVNALAGMNDAKFYARFLYALNVEWIWDESSPTTGTLVYITHPDLTPWMLTTRDKVRVTFEDLTDEDGRIYGTRYSGTATFTLNGFTYTFTSENDVLIKQDVSLSDDANNDEILEMYNDCPSNVTLQGRTLWKDGSWNTLCLPFDFSARQLAMSTLQGATLKTFASSDFDISTGTLTLNFVDAGSISAGMPYIVKWRKPDDYVKYDGTNANKCSDVVNPVFEDVVIRCVSGSVGSFYADFTGNFSPVILAANDRTVLYLDANNTLYHPSEVMTVGACRAVFNLHNGLVVGGMSASVQNVPIRAFVLNFGEDLTPAHSPVVEERVSNANAWYTLDGRRLSHRPTAKGLYVKDGRKIVVK